MEFVSHKHLSAWLTLFLNGSSRDVLHWRPGRREWKQNNMCLYLLGWISAESSPTSRKLTKTLIFSFFLSFVLSETTDHGSSKCDKWVYKSSPSQIRSGLYVSFFLLLASWTLCNSPATLDSVFSPSHLQRRPWRRPSCVTAGEGEGQRRDLLEGDQRRNGLDQLGAGEGQCPRHHQLHHPEVLPYSWDQDCQSATGAKVLGQLPIPPPTRPSSISLCNNHVLFSWACQTPDNLAFEETGHLGKRGWKNRVEDFFFLLIGDLRQKKCKKKKTGLGRHFLLIVPLQYFLKRDLFL